MASINELTLMNVLEMHVQRDLGKKIKLFKSVRHHD